MGLWTKNFHFIKSYKICDQDENLYRPKNKLAIWINDSVLLTENHKICFATSKRSLRFFSLSAEYFKEEFSIYGFPDIPNCLDYAYDVFDIYYVLKRVDIN